MLEYIYICRHGFRANWIDPSIKSGPTGMSRDPPLAVYGEEQATILGDFLASPRHTSSSTSNAALTSPPAPELVFSSPFYRCIQSALPTAQKLGKQIMLEHGVQEWYSPVIPGTGLHPRPSSPTKLASFFPNDAESISTTYQSTLYPSRRGESLAEIHARAELFVEAWVGRIECDHPEVRSVVIFAHAASLIALGRALTGDRELDIVAGCASTSLYRRKASPPASLDQIDTTPPSSSSTSNASTEPGGVGQWSIVWNGEASYLPNGLERNWSFNDVILKPDGEVISDTGDTVNHELGDEQPEGLAEGMERFLRRGRPPFGSSSATETTQVVDNGGKAAKM